MVPEPVEQPVRKVSCVGVPLAAITMDEAQRLADSSIASRAPCLFSTGNAYTLVMAQSNERLMAHYHQADAVLPDGMIPVWLTKLLPRSVPDKLAGPVFFQELFGGRLREGTTLARLERGGARADGAYGHGAGCHDRRTYSPPSPKCLARSRTRRCSRRSPRRADALFGACRR